MDTIRRRYPLLLAAAAAMLATPLLLAATSGTSKVGRATTVTCGQTITTSITLTNDLSCGSGNGLNVGANGITIDLNGHTIFNSNVAIDGIENIGHTGVTITNGAIIAFGGGVSFESGANGGRAQALRLAGNGEGVSVVSSNSVVISGNFARGNTSSGIFVSGGSGDRVSGNWLENNAVGIVAGGSSLVVSQNRALNNANAGIELTTSGTGQVSGNIANGNGSDGIDTGAGASALTLSGNRASFNGALGINAFPLQNDGGGNVVQDNATAVQCRYVVCTEVSS